jgi:hypothetical protein
MIEFNHNHNYIYGDVPALGECECGAYRVWDSESQTYREYERQGE